MQTRPSLLALTSLALGVSVLGCASHVDAVDPPVAVETCGGAVCFVAGKPYVARWGDGQIELVALPIEQSPCVAVAREGVVGDGDPPSLPAPIAATSLDVMVRGAEPGAVLPIVSRDQAALQSGPFATIRARRVDPTTGDAIADEEGVDGIATVVSVDENVGAVTVQMTSRWSSGVSRALTLAVEGPPDCN